MKLNLGKRVVLFVHWLVSLLLIAALIFPDYLAQAISLVSNSPLGDYQSVVFAALLVVYALISIAVLCIIFRRGSAARSERGFITVDSSETGKVRIAISAIEQMVKQAVHSVDGIADMKISITNSDDAIAILVNVAMVNGSHVPTVTLNMQRAIRQFVEMNCGVAVRSVSINIQSVANPAEGGRKSRHSDSRIQPAPVAYPAAQAIPDPIQPELDAAAAQTPVDDVVNTPAQDEVVAEAEATAFPADDAEEPGEQAYEKEE